MDSEKFIEDMLKKRDAVFRYYNDDHSANTYPGMSMPGLGI